MADEVELPTEDDIGQLPRWAQVAFAARCARRVLPLLKHLWPQAPHELTSKVMLLTDVAERSAALTRPHFPAEAHTVSVETSNTDPLIAHLVADSALAAARSAVGRASEYTSREAGHAAATARQADERVAPLIAADFRTVLQAAQDGRWAHDTAVPPEVFGPLWPDGPPPGWPADPQDDEFKLVFRAVAEPGVSAETVRKHAVELFRALNEYSLEKYGRRLTKDRFRRLVLEHTGAVV